MIILDDFERKYLEDLLNETNISHKYFWCREKIIDKLKTEAEKKEKMAQCEHEPGTYSGKKDCCTKCGSFYKENMGFSWDLKT